MARAAETSVQILTGIVRSMQTLVHNTAKTPTEVQRAAAFDAYRSQVMPLAATETELFGHILTWNRATNPVMNSWVAFPQLALRGPLDKYDDEDLIQNAVAHLMKLGPRELVRAIQYGKWLTREGLPIQGGSGSMLKWALAKYLRVREANERWWTSTAVSHRQALTALYAYAHIKPDPWAQAILYGAPTNQPHIKVKKSGAHVGEEYSNGFVAGAHVYPTGSIFEAIAALRGMEDDMAAGTILEYNIPMPIAISAVAHGKSANIIAALMRNMTANQFINSSNMLSKLIGEDEGLKAEFRAAQKRIGGDKRVNALKAGVAAEVIEDTDVKAAMLAVQETALSNAAGIEGDWLVQGDRSESMTEAISVAIQIAALITRQVRGKVYMIWYNTEPEFHDVTGKTLDELQQQFKRVRPSGWTACGVAMAYMREKGLSVDGIVNVGDGAENKDPRFIREYQRYAAQLGKDPGLYHIDVDGQTNRLTQNAEMAGVTMRTFPLRGVAMDHYTLPNIVAALKTNVWGLLDEIRSAPLLTLDAVFAPKKEVA